MRCVYNAACRPAVLKRTWADLHCVLSGIARISSRLSQTSASELVLRLASDVLRGLTVSNRMSVVFYLPSRLCLHVLYSLDIVAIAYSHEELYIRQDVCPNNMVNCYNLNFMATDFFYTSPSPTFGSPSGWNGVETHKPSELVKVELNSRVHSESLRSTNTIRETHTRGKSCSVPIAGRIV